MKYSDFIDGKYFLRNWRLKGPHFLKKIASGKKFYWYFFLLKFLVSVFINIINMPEEFQKNTNGLDECVGRLQRRLVI